MHRVELIKTAQEEYDFLKTSNDKFDRQLLKAINRIIEILNVKPEFGDRIPRSLIPKYYLAKEITNLWRIELPGFWRLLYTIQGDRINVISFILEWMDHDTYNKLFGYKKK